MNDTPPFQAAALELRARDERLRIAIDAVGPCTLVPANRSPYEALLNAIAHQQVHGAAAKAILGRMHALYAGRDGTPRWPTPQELVDTPEDALRGAGLSRSKVLAMRDVAAKTLDGTVPDLATIAALSNDEIVERLVAVRGVGRWTAEMLLIFTLGRPDVLPVDDFGVRYGFQLLHGKRKMPPPKWLAKYGERWAPHRSTVAWYMWRYVDWVRANGLEPRRARKKKAAKPATRGTTVAGGEKSVGVKSVGSSAAGKEPSGKRSSGKKSSGKRAAETRVGGKASSRTRVAGRKPTGTTSAGKKTVGTLVRAAKGAARTVSRVARTALKRRTRSRT